MRMTKAVFITGLIAAGTAFGMLAAEPASAAPDQARTQECQSKLVKLQQARILQGLSVKPSGIQMVVDGETWRAIDFKVKTEMVRTVVCMIVEGDQQKSAVVEVRDNLNNKVVGRYDGRNLEVAGQ